MSNINILQACNFTQPCNSWRRIKHDFLHHFHKPRVDLLVWILITKLAPTYYRKLDRLMNDNGRYHELACWRKAFKRDWKRSATTPITLPLNDKYRLNVLTWVCTCPHFCKSRFLLCKHLVQSVHPVPPIFFLEVKRNRTTPFWQHASLVSLAKPAVDGEDMGIQPSTSAQVLNGENVKDLHGDASDESDDGVIDLGDYEPGRHQTMGEKLIARANLLREFADGLSYQVQFNDHRWVETLEREGGSLFRLASSCLDRERRFSSTRGTSPTTWERATTSAMYYRTRPPRRDAMS